MAIISVRIFIRSIVVRKKKKNLRDNTFGRTFTFTPKGQVIVRGKPNKAVQVNCSQGFPFHPFFFHVAGRFWIDTNILEIETWPVLYGATFIVDTRPGETRIPHEWPSFIEYRSPRNQDVGFFSNVHVGIRLKYLSLTPWNAT